MGRLVGIDAGVLDDDAARAARAPAAGDASGRVQLPGHGAPLQEQVHVAAARHLRPPHAGAAGQLARPGAARSRAGLRRSVLARSKGAVRARSPSSAAGGTGRRPRRGRRRGRLWRPVAPRARVALGGRGSFLLPGGSRLRRKAQHYRARARFGTLPATISPWSSRPFRPAGRTPPGPPQHFTLGAALRAREDRPRRRRGRHLHPLDPDVYVNEEPAPRLKLDPLQTVLEDKQGPPSARASTGIPSTPLSRPFAAGALSVAVAPGASKCSTTSKASVVYFYCSKREAWCRRGTTEVEVAVEVEEGGGLSGRVMPARS